MICANYSTFDGLEMLRDSILSIRDIVDSVVVVHQVKDFYGNDEDENNKQILNDLLNNKIIDKIFVVDTSKMIKEDGMIIKRNIGLNYLKSINAEYVMTMDADEFYISGDVIKTIDKMKKDNIDTCYSKIVTYYGDQFHFYDDVYYVPSIYKIKPSSNYGNFNVSLICDPLRRMLESKYILSSELKMHHLSYIRENLQLKYRSSLARGSSKINKNMEIAARYISSWKSGDKALVFDTKGDLINMTLEKSEKRWLND